MARPIEITGLVTERFPSASRNDEFEITLYNERGQRLTAVKARENIAPPVGTKYAVALVPERTDG